MGTHWSIPTNEEVVSLKQPAEQPRQQGSHNVRGQRERGQPQQQFKDVPFGRAPTNAFQNQVGYYMDYIRGAIQYQNSDIDEIYMHFLIERQPNMPPHGPYILTWEEMHATCDCGAKSSGAHGDDDEDA